MHGTRCNSVLTLLDFQLEARLGIRFVCLHGSNQRSYLWSAREVDSNTLVGTGERRYVYYKSLIIRVKSCSYKLFFPNQLQPLGGREDLDGNI